MAGSERDKAVDLAISQIERQFGKGSIMRLGGVIKCRRSCYSHGLFKP